MMNLIHIHTSFFQVVTLREIPFVDTYDLPEDGKCVPLKEKSHAFPCQNLTSGKYYLSEYKGDYTKYWDRNLMHFNSFEVCIQYT